MFPKSIKYGLLAALMLFCCKPTSGNYIELEVVSQDAASYRWLYVLDVTRNDTLAVFDSLSFAIPNRNILNFSVDSAQKLKLILLTATRQQLESETFTVSPQRNTFLVKVGDNNIEVSSKDFQYPKKNGNENSYFVFLLIFFVIKLLISIAYIFTFRLPAQLISTVSGVFLLSSFIEWTIPVHYLLRLGLIITFEFVLFLITSRKILPLLHNIVLTVAANIAGLGLILLAYMVYVFW